jgi:hypothetical protein
MTHRLLSLRSAFNFFPDLQETGSLGPRETWQEKFGMCEGLRNAPHMRVWKRFWPG